MTQLSKKHLMILMAAASQVIITILLSMLFVPVPRDNKIFPGVFINGIDVSGMTKDEAIAEVSGKIHGDPTSDIVFKEGSRQWTYSLKALGYEVDVSRAVDEAVALSKDRGILGKALELMKIKTRKKYITVQNVVDHQKLENTLRQLASEVEDKALDARFEFDNGAFKLIPEKAGKTLDPEEAEKRINETLAQAADNIVMVPLKETTSSIRSKDLNRLKNLLSFGVTVVEGNHRKWKTDLTAAVKAIDGSLLKPGETFSFNDHIWGKENKTGVTFGPTGDNMTQERLQSNGYAQAASTLYQAVLYGGLKVEKRLPHYVVPRYASPGFDAAIATGKSDMEFQNTSDSPVYINALIKDNRVMINLLGIKSGKGTFQILPVTKNDGNQYQITELYRAWYEKGAEVRREKISADRYALTQP